MQKTLPRKEAVARPFRSTLSPTTGSLAMPRPLEHGDRIGVRLTPEAKRLLGTAAAALGVSRSHFARAVIVQALRHEPIARAALEELDRPAYPQFTAELLA